MKKLLLSAIALVACMSVQAQVVYYNDFSQESDYEGLTIINANGDYYGSDENTWSPQNYDGKHCMHNGWTSYGGGNVDDWLITPGIELSTAYIYKFSMNTRCSSYPQTLTVYVGTATTAEAMTQTVLPTFTFTNNYWVPVEGDEFTVAEDGTYYIGVHDTSAEDMYNTFVTELKLEIVGENTTTGISTINAAAAGKTFSIDGRQVNKAQAGLYIQNGKKVLVK